MRYALAALAAAALLASGCGEKTDAKKPGGPPPTLVTVTKAQVRPLEITEDSVGSLENLMDPRIAAEVPGRIVRVNGAVGRVVRKGDVLAEIDPADFEIQARADEAEVARLAALLANQERVVERQRELVKQNFISQNAADDAIAQRNALRESLAAARAKAEAGKRSLGKARVVSPIDGRVETQIVAVGDYVKVGDPLFKLVGTTELRAHLPFPESAAPRLKRGQKVRLASPLVPGKVVEGEVSDIKPTVTETSRALDVIVRFTTEDQAFLGGGTVNGQVVVAVKPEVVMVPEESVVLRPAGKVVYVVADGKALQRPVETGHRKGGLVEIVSGLAAGETVAVDGAGFLTNNAPVALPRPRGEAGKAPEAGKAGDAAKL
ncbi:MAG: efflux RND transporter periplasmic adaptor subunit [Burkholderiales bacterium]|nr:efflux RND transporter periplasmic adaptor subunit [Burkholderiales bacterium]